MSPRETPPSDPDSEPVSEPPGERPTYELTPDSRPPGAAASNDAVFTVSDPGPDPFEPDEPPPLELWRAVGDVTPWGTMLMLLAWAILFAIMTLQGELGDTNAALARGANTTPADIVDGAWRLLASTFLHASAAHVLLNALTLLVLGQAVERIFAPGAFPLVCTLGGMAASLGSLAWRQHTSPSGPGLSVGGSGLVFALGGALLVVALRLRRQLAVGRARAFGAVILVLTLPALSAGLQQHGTDSAAHATGLISGALLGMGLPLRTSLGGPASSPALRAVGILAAAALLAAFGRALRAG